MKLQATGRLTSDFETVYFTTISDSPSMYGLVICCECSAVVPDLPSSRSKHMEFHNTLLAWADLTVDSIEKVTNRCNLLANEADLQRTRINMFKSDVGSVIEAMNKVREEYPY